MARFTLTVRPALSALLNLSCMAVIVTAYSVAPEGTQHMLNTLRRIAIHTLMLLFVSTGITANGDTWADVRAGDARIPGYFTPLIRATFPACPTEDSAWCYWDGGTRGNHRGGSFVTLTDRLTVPVGKAPDALPEGGQPIPAGMLDTLSNEPGQAGRDWSLCRWYVDDTSWVICPDGYRISS